MNRKIFTSEQIQRLSKNKNVRRCGSKSVRYTKSFRASAIKQYNEEGLAAVEIFESAGFDLDIIGKRRPNKLMHHWNKVARAEGILPAAEKIVVVRNGEKKIRNGHTMRALKAKVAYLEAENDFLEQLRARIRK